MKTTLDAMQFRPSKVANTTFTSEMSELRSAEKAENRLFKRARTEAFHYETDSTGKLLLVKDGIASPNTDTAIAAAFKAQALKTVTLQQHEQACEQFIATILDHTYSPVDGMVMDNRTSRFAKLLNKGTSIDSLSKQLGCGKRGLARKRLVDVVTRAELLARIDVVL